MTNTVISYPIPAYQNLPIESQYYKPSQFFISAIQLGNTTFVTTSVNNNYEIGQLVRLLIPFFCGSRGLNEQLGIVISLPNSNQVELNISSLGIDPFILSSSPTQAQIVAVGDYKSGSINEQGRSPLKTYIPGSFQNISPL